MRTSILKDAEHHAEQLDLTFEQASALVIDSLGILLRAAPGDLDRAIHTVLARLAKTVGAERAHVLLRVEDTWMSAHEWCADSVAPRLAPHHTLSATEASILNAQDAGTGAIYTCTVASLPSGPHRQLLMAHGVQSQIVVHFPPEAAVTGLIGLERVISPQGFPEIVGWLLQSLGDGVSATLARRDAETHLRKTRTQQSETLERLRATLAAMPELLLEMDDDGRCVDFHCSAPDLLVAPPAEVLGKSLEETLPPAIALLQRRGMNEARQNGTAHVGPYALGKGDNQRWYTLTIAKRGGAEDRQGFVFRINDVTPQRDRESENTMLVEMARRMTNMAMVLDPDLRIRWMNAALETRSGYSLAEVRGRFPTDFTDPTASPNEIAKINSALQTRTPVRAEINKRDRNGTSFSVAIDIQPMRRADGVFEGFIVIETDITERKHHEAALERLASEADAARLKLQSAIDSIPDSFAMYDADDRLMIFNTEYMKSMPAAADKVKVGMTFSDIIDKALAAGAFPDALGREEAWKSQRMLQHEQAKGDFELRLSNGRWMRAYERPTPDGGRVILRSDITALKHAEKRLNEIIDGARIGTWEYSVATNTAVLNEHWAAMLGAEPNALPFIDAEQFPRLIDPIDYTRIRAAMRAVLSGEKERLEQEIKLRHRDGHWVHVLLRGQIIDGDKPHDQRRISGVGLDLTERRHAENRLQNILEASSVGTWQLNNDSGNIIIDEQYAAMLGYTRDELLPWTKSRFESLLHPMDIPRLQAGLAALYRAQKSTISHEFRMRHRDGHWIWILSRVRVSRWTETGEAAEESGVHVNITESKNREAALADAKKALEHALDAQKASDQRFSDIAAVSDEWFWEMDDQDRIVFMSSGFERNSAIPVANMYGKTLAEIGFRHDSDSVSADWTSLGKLLGKREKFSDFLFGINPQRDRSTLWLRISGTPIIRPDGTYAGYRGVGSNVTEFIAATERAEAANLAKSRFIATMSHELRTPLTGVLGMADLLGDTAVSEQQREMIDTIRESGEGLLAIVNDILDLAKIEAGKMTVDRLVFTPAHLFRQVHALFAPRAHAQGLVLGLDITPACSKRRLGDAHRIQQILNNLVNNAIKFTESGSIKMIGAIGQNENGDFLEIRVVDTGIGMTAEQSAKVWDEFEQAEGSTARRFGGTGLGLSITRHLVTIMGGSITLETAIGRGTSICVQIPLADAPAAEIAHKTIAGSSLDDFAGLRVLVADDNRTNRQILKSLLNKAKINVTLAEDGHEAHQLYRPDDFDMLLLDISMPGLDGIGALHAIRATEAAAGSTQVPALAVTANAMQHQIDDYLAAGFAGHVAKPFRKSELLASIAANRSVKA